MNTALCKCEDRKAATQAGTFRWEPFYSAWVDTTLPVRKSKVYGIVTIKNGSYRWHDCPWCQHELPIGSDKA